MIDVRKGAQRWRRLPTTVRDLPLALALLAGSYAPTFHSHGTELGGLPHRPFDGWALLVAALQSLPMAVRRRWPAACLAVVAAGFAADQLCGYHTVAGTGLTLAVLNAGAHLERRRRGTGAAASAGYVLLAVALVRRGAPEGVDEYVVFYLLLVLVWAVGAWWRSTRVAEAERRRRVAEETRAAERARIARELHDVVTHHVTAMIVQAEAARYLTAAPDRLEAALASVTDTGRRAVTDLRHLLDLLDPGHTEGAPAPPVGRLRTLVEQTRQAGQPVEFTEEGTPAEETGSADVVAYRIVQEALTNALKHAPGGRTSVRVEHGEREITVEVGTARPDDAAHAMHAAHAAHAPGGKGGTAGTGSAGGAAARVAARAAAAAGSGSGRGLAGLRERVDVLGGDFDAGRGADDRFVVRARIPAGSRT